MQALSLVRDSKNIQGTLMNKPYIFLPLKTTTKNSYAVSCQQIYSTEIFEEIKC